MNSQVASSPDMGGGSAGGEASEEDKFKPSFLLKNTDEVDKLTHTGLQNRIRALHKVAIQDPEHKIFKRQDWVNELGGLKKRMIQPQEGEKVYPPEEAMLYCARINQEIEDYDKKTHTNEEITLVLDANVRSAKEVIGDFNEIINNPDSAKEAKIKQDLEILGKYAKNIGVFDGVKDKIEEIQRKLPFLEAAKKIKELDLKQERTEAEGLKGWDPRLSGTVDIYRTAVFYNMMKVWSDLKQPIPYDTDKISKFVDILNYEDPPIRELMNVASAQLQLTTQDRSSASKDVAQVISLLKQQLQTGQTSFTPENFARALGVASPELQMELYRKAFYFKSAVDISVGQEPKFFPSITESEQKQWRAEAWLATVCAHKKRASRVDYLFPDDEHSEIMELSKDTLESLFGDENGKNGVVGTLEVASLYTVIYHQNIPLSELLTTPVQTDNMTRDQQGVYREQLDEYKKLKEIINNSRRPGTINSVWEVNDGPKHTALRKLISHWLKVNRGMSEAQAYEAEINGDSWKYICNLVEDKDVEGKLPPKTDMKHLPTWMAIHLQKRYEKKIRGDDEWGYLGGWAEYAKRKTGNENYLGDYDKKRGVLPNRVLPNAMEKITVGNFGNRGIPRNPNLTGIREFVDRSRKDVYMYDLFLENGRRLLANPRVGRNSILSIPWLDVTETPFADYYSNTINPAILVFNVAVKGPSTEKDISYQALGNACRKLGIERHWRDRLKLIKYGIKQKSTKLEPYDGSINYKIFEGELKRLVPNFYY